MQGIGVGCRRSSQAQYPMICSGVTLRARKAPISSERSRSGRKRRPAALSISGRCAHTRGARREAFPCCRIPAQSRQPTDTGESTFAAGGGARRFSTAAHDIINTHIEGHPPAPRPVDSRTVHRLGESRNRLPRGPNRSAVDYRHGSLKHATPSTIPGIALLFRRHGSRQRSGIVRHCSVALLPAADSGMAIRMEMLVAANQTGTDLVGMVVQQAAARARGRNT